MRVVALVLLAQVVAASSSKLTFSQWKKQQPKRIFCFAAVQSNPEPTIDVVRKQLAACDGFAFYSNFTDQSKKIFKATSRPTSAGTGSYGFLPGQGGGSANRDLFRDVWDHVVDKEPGFDWYVKIDPDTFLRPEKLRQILANFEPESNTVLSDDMDNKPTGVLGSLYVLSHGALNMYKQKREDCQASVTSQFEDQFMEQCMKRHDVKIEHPNNGFANFLSNGGTSNFLMTRETDYWAELNDKDFENLAAGISFCIKDYLPMPKIRAGRKKCFSPDVAAIHPIKDLKQMERVYNLLGEGAKMSALGAPESKAPEKTPENKPRKKMF